MKDVRCTYDFADNDDVDNDDSDNNDCYADDNDCQCQNVITVFRLPFSIWCWSYWMAEIPLNRNETNQTESQRNIYRTYFQHSILFYTHTHTFARKQFSIRTCLPKSIYIHKLYSNVVRLLVISFMESSWNLRCFYYYSKESFQV